MKSRILAALVWALVGAPAALLAQTVDVTIGPGMSKEPITGRMFVVFTRDSAREPREQIGSYSGTMPFFGIDVDALRAGRPVTFDKTTLGFPTTSLADIPAGDYFVQALLDVYSKVTPKHGHTIWVPWDQWEGRRVGHTPGDLTSAVQKVHWDPRTSKLTLQLTQQIPAVVVPPDTKWVKRVKIQSKMLSEWWGHPVYLGATVLLPRGWEEHPEQRYPTIYIQGHFGLNPPFGFNPDAKPETPEQRQARLKRGFGTPALDFAQAWMGDDFPRMVAITFQHPTPWFDDSYAVNSANQGPYGDAILTELIPYLEKQFRLIPEASGRLLQGGSTGGWVSLALQVYHPTFFGGTWSGFPDGVDLTRNQNIDMYNDENAFHPNKGLNEWTTVDRPFSQDGEGQILLTHRQFAQMEMVLGSHSRGGQQWQLYDAVYGPVGDDGYPKPMYDRKTGVIDKSVSAYARDHGYDLTDYLRKNWPTIGKDLTGKIHMYTGEMDTFYLHLGVYKLEEAMKTFTDPSANAEFDYGRPMKVHGWSPWTTPELIRTMARYIAEHGGQAPPTA